MAAYFLQHYYHPPIWMKPTGFIRRRSNPVSCTTSRRAMGSDADEQVVVQRYPTKNLSNRFCKRRELLLEAAAGFSLPVITWTNSSSPSTVALAEEGAAVQEFRLYVDDVNKFKILIPPDWEVASGESEGFKSLTAFYPQEPSNSNVSIVITGLGADFTRLESFGKVDEFAENLIGGLDRSWQRPPGVAAKLLDSKSANGLYYIEYTLQNPGETRRHLFSVLGIANNGWYNRLYTLTGQIVDEEAEKYGPAIEKAVASFRLI